MAVLLSLKKIDSLEVKDDIEESCEPEKYSLGIVKSYFRNLMKTNSYVVGKSGKRKSPVPEVVKEFFTLKNVEEVASRYTEEEETSQEPLEEEPENLLNEYDYSNSLSVENSFTNLKLRLIDDSLEEAEERLDDIVAKSEEKEMIGDEGSFTFSFDESIDESCFGRLRLEEVDHRDSEDEFEIDLSEDEETDSDDDIVVNHLSEGEEIIEH